MSSPLGLPIGLEAAVMTPTGVIFLFFSSVSSPIAPANGVLLLKFMLVFDEEGDRRDSSDHLISEA